MLPKSLANIDRSSWVSWICYYAGFTLGLTPAKADDLVSGRWPLGVALVTVLVFFLITISLQRYMRIELTANTFGTPQQLVTTGAFRISRNPIYLAFLIPLAGLMVISVPAALLAIAAYLVTMTLWVISREEAVLAERFPEAFTAYCSRTPRWLVI